MRDHIGSCILGKIKCPIRCCPQMMSIEEVIVHLKDSHQLVVWSAEANGEVKHGKWMIVPTVMQNLILGEEAYWNPVMATIGGQTFLLNCAAKDGSLFFWVTILGTVIESQKYESTITLKSRKAHPTIISLTGKVYNIEMSVEDVLEDQYGVLEVSKSKAGKIGEIMENGNMPLYTNYRIVRK